MIAEIQTKLADLRDLTLSLSLRPANDASILPVIKNEIPVKFANPVLAYPVAQYPAQQIVADKKFVQKKRAANVLIADPIVLSQEMFIYRSQINTDENNPFFYDSSAETDFDMILTAASQQLCRTVFHKHLNYSLDSQFNLKDFALTMMTNFNVNDDVIIDISLQSMYRPPVNMPHDLLMKIWGHQEGKIFAIGTAQWFVKTWNMAH